MALTDVKVRSAKPTEKPYKLTDGEGIHLMVHPNGSKYWRLQYRFDGKQKTLALGVYPEITLSDARQRRDEAKRQVATGVDPGEQKKVDKQTRKAGIENNFKAIALEWHEYKRPNWSKGYAEDLMEGFENDIFPYIGKRPIAEIKPLEMLEALRKLEKRGCF